MRGFSLVGDLSGMVWPSCFYHAGWAAGEKEAGDENYVEF